MGVRKVCIAALSQQWGEKGGGGGRMFVFQETDVLGVC